MAKQTISVKVVLVCVFLGVIMGGVSFAEWTTKNAEAPLILHILVAVGMSIAFSALLAAMWFIGEGIKRR